MGDNIFTKGYQDATALTESQLDTAYKSLKLDISNTTSMTSGSTSGQVLTSNGSGVAASFQAIPEAPLGPFALRNYGLSAVASSNILVLRLKTKAGNDPSAGDPVDFTYSTNGATSATYNAVEVTAATSISVNASATLGLSGTSTQRVYVYGYYNTSTSSVKLAVSSQSNLDNGQKHTTTAVAATADSAIPYATAALSVTLRMFGSVDAARNSSGNWQTPVRVNITNFAPANVGREAYRLSSSSGSFNSTSSTFIDVTNLSISIRTAGGAVRLQLKGDPSTTSVSSLSADTTTAGAIRFVRGTVALSVFSINTAAAGGSAPGNFWELDTPAAGTYTYKVQMKSNGTNVVTISNVILTAKEE